MDIHIIQQHELDEINDALNEIKSVAGRLGSGRDAAPDIAIYTELKRIRAIFAPTWYVFKCTECGSLRATTEKDLKLMLKPCKGCEAEQSLAFIEIATERPRNATICSTF